MVNFRDPAVIAQDYCAYNFEAMLQEATDSEFSFGSGAHQAVAHPGRSLHVRLSGSAAAPASSCHSMSRVTHNRILAYSWEFVTTLEFEWAVIQGRLQYRWTFWVRNNILFALVSCSRVRLSLRLICSFITR
jgi:hypothetical protein